MTQLTEQHTIFGIIDKIVSDVAAMRIMTGDTAHLATTGLPERIRFAAQRVSIAHSSPHNMGLVAKMPMAGQAQLVDRLDQLRFIGAAVGVVTGLTHAGLDRAVDKLLFLDLQRHI